MNEVYICPVKKIAVFASGAGTNAAQIIDRFRQHPSIAVSLIVCNKPDAGVVKIAARENIPVLLLDKEKFFQTAVYIREFQEKEIDFIVLAGFLWKIPAAFIQQFPERIINIHPALLPKYGGKGMYGQHVHQVVLDNLEGESGITIHYVDEVYDHGQIVFQARCPVDATDTAMSLARKVAALEHAHYPEVIEQIVKKQAKNLP